MFTVVVYILRRLADQDSPQGHRAKTLLELIVGRMKALRLAQFDREEAALKTSGRHPPAFGPDGIDALENIRSRRRRLLSLGVDPVLRNWWFHQHAPGSVSVSSVSTQLVKTVGFDLIREGIALSVDFLFVEEPKITTIDYPRTVTQLDKLLVSMKSAKPVVDEQVLSTLCNTFAAWSYCSGERGRPVWQYRGFDEAVLPIPS